MHKLILFTFLFVPTAIFAQISDGCYAAQEKLLTGTKNERWNYFDTLLVCNDSVYFYKSAACIIKNDTMYSVADYGFYYYAGHIIKSKQKNFISFFLTHCDYCIDGYIYRHINKYGLFKGRYIYLSYPKPKGQYNI